jgi:hypothetical protein
VGMKSVPIPRDQHGITLPLCLSESRFPGIRLLAVACGSKQSFLTPAPVAASKQSLLLPADGEALTWRKRAENALRRAHVLYGARALGPRAPVLRIGFPASLHCTVAITVAHRVGSYRERSPLSWERAPDQVWGRLCARSSFASSFAGRPAPTEALARTGGQHSCSTGERYRLSVGAHPVSDRSSEVRRMGRAKRPSETKA